MANILSTYNLFFRSLFTFSAVMSSAVISSEALATAWDWHPRESLTPEQQASLNKYCRGSYIDQWQTTATGDETKLYADLIYQQPNGDVYLKGAAELQQSNITIQADAIKSTQDQTFTTEGKTVIRQPGELITSDKVLMKNSGEGQESNFDNAQFVLHESRLRGGASSIENSYQGVIFLEEGFYTSCEPGNDSWQLYGSSIVLNPNTGFGTAKHVRLKIMNVPIFYMPWLRFPIDSKRHTGFLFPGFGYSNSDGLALSIPLYLNLAPNYDATVTSNILTNKGEGVDVELRHLSKYGETSFEQSTFNDSTEGTQIVRKLETNQQFTGSFSSGFLLEDNPTEDIYPEANTTSIGEQDYYERSAYATYSKGMSSTNITVKRYQTPDESVDKPLEWRPRISSSYQYSNGIFSYQPLLQYTDFVDPDQSIVDGERQVLNQSFDLTMNNQWGFFNPGVLAQYRKYQMNDGNEAELNHMSYYFDSGLIFERSLKLDDSRWRQTLEPKLSYLNSPYKDQTYIPNFDSDETTITYSQAFSHTRFSGNDRVGDTEQFTFGIESHFFDQDNVERWALKLGQIYYLKDREISVDGDLGADDSEKSGLLSSISYYRNELISFNLDLNYDQDASEFELGQVSMKFGYDDVRFQASYLYAIDEEDGDTNQSQFSTIFPINNNWTFYHQYTYDWIDEINSANVTGFGYENCCIKTSFSYQAWRDDDENMNYGFFLKFILRSFSGLGKDGKISSVETQYWNNGDVGYN